jgi:hypothetical protein
MSIVMDQTISVGTIESGGAIYIDVTTQQCGSPLSPIPATVPITLAQKSQYSTLFLDTINGGCVGGPCSESPIVLTFANGSSKTDLVYSIAFDNPLPNWLQYANNQDSSGTVSAFGEIREVLFVVPDGTNPPTGLTNLGLTILNTNGNVTSPVKSHVDLFVNAIPVTDKDLPKPPPPPNPGIGPRIVTNYTSPSWVFPAVSLLVLAAVCALVYAIFANREMKKLIGGTVAKTTAKTRTNINVQTMQAKGSIPAPLPVFRVAPQPARRPVPVSVPQIASSVPRQATRPSLQPVARPAIQPPNFAYVS